MQETMEYPFRAKGFNIIIWILARKKARLVSLMDQELLTLPEHLCSHTSLVGLSCTIFSFLCFVF